MKVAYERVSTTQQSTLRQEMMMQEYQIEKAKYECAIAKERFEKTNSELAKDYVENFDKRVEEILSDPNGQLDFNDL